jgi:hypothetical protein
MILSRRSDGIAREEPEKLVESLKFLKAMSSRTCTIFCFGLTQIVSFASL